jgi:copper chaperone CopZ
MKRACSLAVGLSFLVFSFLAGACRRAEPVTATYKVGGMTCDACAANIQTSVGGIEGVLSADVSYKEGAAEVTYDPEKLEPGAVEAAVKRMGYTAERQGF